MGDDQTRRIAVAFARETAKSPTGRLCAACVEVLEVTGAGITLLSGERPGPICVSDSNVAGLESLQFELNEGPCRDAYNSRQAVHAPRLDAAAARRWPPFVDLATSHGIRAVSAYPLINEASGVGVLTLYRMDEGDLSEAQQDASVAVSRVLADTLWSLRANDPPVLAFDEVIPYRAEIHQASGMTAVQLGISPSDALVRMRAHGFANAMTVLEVAAEIVALRLRLPDDRSDAQA